MKNFQGNKGQGSFRRVMQSVPALVLLGFIILIFAWNVFGFLQKMIETGKNRKQAENKVAELEASKAKLEAEIASLNTDEGIEKEIREKFGLAKEGEGLVVIVDEEASNGQEDNTEKKGIFSIFEKWFK